MYDKTYVLGDRLSVGVVLSVPAEAMADRDGVVDGDEDGMVVDSGAR